jgi:autotransporter-associated beta strand protein
VSTEGATNYWRLSTAASGSAGGPNPDGTWDTGITANWDPDSAGNGAHVTWNSNDYANFSAAGDATNAFTVTIPTSTTNFAAGLTVDEGTITMGPGTLSFGANNGVCDIATNAVWNVLGAGTGLVAGTGGITKNGPGTLNLGGTMPYSRASAAVLTINSGILNFDGDLALGVVPTSARTNAVTINGGTLRQIAGGFTLAVNRGVTIGPNGGTIEVTNLTSVTGLSLPSAASFTINGSSAAVLTKTGGGRFTMNTTANTYSGKYVILAGSINIPGDGRLGNVPGSFQADHITMNGSSATLRIAVTSGVTLNANRGIVLGSGGGALAQPGPGTLTYNGIISGTSGGTLRINSNDAPGGGTSAGIILLGGANTYDGSTTVASGMTLKLGAAGVVPDGSTVTLSGASTVFDLNGFDETIGSLSSSVASTVTLGTKTLTLSNGRSTFAGTIGGTGNLVKNGTSATPQTLSGVNTYTGNTFVNAGTLKLGLPNALSTSPIIVTNGARLDPTNQSPTILALSGGGNVVNNFGILTVNGDLTSGSVFNQYSCFSGTITNGSLVKDGTHAMALRGSNTWDGTLTFNNGTFSVGAAPDRIPTTTALAVPATAIFQLDANNQTISSLSGNGQVNLGGGILTVNQTGPNTFSGSIQNSELVGSSTATGHGLRGYYYDNLDMTSLKAVRDDATVNFTDLTSAAQLPAAIYPNTNQVSVRWLGKVLTTTNGTYTFTTTCDDGSRLWVNGTLVVDNWVLQGATAKSGAIALAANTRYDIVMEFFNNTGGSSAKLSWTPPGDTTSVIIPTEYLFLPRPGGLVKSGPDTLTLNTVNTYSGGTAVNQGILDVQTDGGLGAGNVAVSDPATLQLDSGATNGYISASADLLLNGGAPLINLNFTGTNFIHALSYDGGSTYQPAGVYGAAGSGATYENSRFGGSGYLTVSAAPSTNVLTTSGSPAVYGSSLNLTSTVTGGAGTPTGTVSFYEGGNFLGTATLNGSGIAVLTANHLSVTASPHSLMAVYGGDTTYATSSSSAVSQAITVATLSPSVTVSNKVYDATTNASVSSVSFGGIHTLDSNYVHLAGTVAAFFHDPNVGNGKPVDISGLALAGSLSGNYTLASTSASSTANITPRGLTATNITANSRVYDGTTNATISGSAALSGVIPGDTVTLGGTPVASFATKTVGTNKTVTVNGYTLSGAQAGNYSTPVPTLTANITAALLSVVGVTANSKVYDGTNTATLSGTASLSNLVSGDVVTFGGTPSATFNNKNAGVAKPVTVVGYTNSGADASNYVFSQPIGLTADITAVGTTVLLTSSPNPSSLTSNVVFSLTVSANSPTLDSPGGANSLLLQTNGVSFLPLLTPIATAPGSSTNSTSTTLLKAGANTVTAQYVGDGLNYAASPVVTITQTVNSATCAATNKLLGITANLNGTLTLNFLGTPQAQYYVVASTNAAAAVGTWTALADSTNSVTNVSGLWSYTTTNGLPRRFYRGASVVPCP